MFLVGLILTSQSAIFQLRGVFLGGTSTEQGLMCLAQGHNAVSDAGEARFPVKHSTTEPLPSQFKGGIFTYM